MLRKAGRAMALAFCLATPGAAYAAECQPANGVSPCIDSNSLWLATGSARWLTIPEPVALAPGRVGLAVAGQALFRVLSVVVPSPNATGREIRLVDSVLEQQLLLAAGLGKSLELGLALPVILRQSGAGSAGLTAQRAASLDSTAARDPRASLAFAASLSASLAIKPRLELGLPVGNRAAYASAGGVTVAPALPLEVRHGRFAAGAELGLRLRPVVELGSLRWGSQAALGLAVSLQLLPGNVAALAAEALLLPSLVNASSERGRALGVETRSLPAEWLLSLRSRPNRDEPWSVAIGAGAGLALSTESFSGGTRRFVAPTSPALRLLAELRYAPRD